MDSLAILVAAETLVNLCGKVNAYIQWLMNKFSDRQNLLQVLRFEIGSLAYVFEAISVHLGDEDTAHNPFKSFEEAHLQRLLDSMNECRLVLGDLQGMLQPTVIRPQGQLQQRARSPSVGGVNWEMLPLLKRKFSAYRKGMGLSLRTIELAAKFASEPHNTALRSDIDCLSFEAAELLQFLREQVCVDASLAHLANCIKSALDVAYSMQRLASPTSSSATSPEMTQIEPGPFRSQSRLAFRSPTPQPLVRNSSRMYQLSNDVPPIPEPPRSQSLPYESNGNSCQWDMPQRNHPILSVAKSPQSQPMEYSRSPTMSPPIPRPQRNQTYDTKSDIKSPEQSTIEFPRHPSVSLPTPRSQRSPTYDTIPLARSPEKIPIQYPVNSNGISPPPQGPLRQQRSQTFQDLSSSPTWSLPKRGLSQSPREYLEPTREYKDSVRELKDTRHEFAQPKRSQPPQAKSPQTTISDSKPSRTCTLSPSLLAPTPPTPFTTSNSPLPWTPPPPLSLDKIAEDPRASSALGLEDYVINYLNKNLLDDSASEVSKLDVQSPRGTVVQPTPPPAPIPQRPVAMPQAVAAQQKAIPDTEMIQRWRQSGSRSFATGDYGGAQLLLEQVVKGSEQRFGNDYEWRAETKSLLAETCLRLGRWDEAGKVLSEKYDGREAQIDGIANGFLRDRQWDKLTWILGQQFEGRENVMEAASRALILDQKWAEAKEMLVGLMKYKTEDSPRGLERMYLLAEVCWSRKDLGDAKQVCNTAIESPKSILQKSDPLYSQFVKLAVQICEAQTERDEADKFKSLLSSGVAECAEIDRLLTMRPKDAVTEIEKGRALKDVKLGTNKQKKSIKENIMKSGRGILGTGRGWALIHALASNGRDSAVELLLRKGIDIDPRDEEGNTPLNVAASHGQDATIKTLLKYRADPSIKNKMGYSPLMTATIKGSQTAIRLMLDAGGDVETRDAGQNTLLMSAVMDKMMEVVKMLLKRGANIESKNQAGRTPLMIAALIGDSNMSKLLLKKQATIDAKDNDGNTALMLAASKEHEAVVELLLRRGADVTATNNSGHNALYVAKKSAIYRTPVVRKLLATQSTVRQQTADTDNNSVDGRPNTVGSGLSRSPSSRSSSSYATTNSGKTPPIDSIQLPRVPEMAVY